MKKELIFSLFREHVNYNLGIKRTKSEQAISERALKRFECGCLKLSDCYKNPSTSKIRAFWRCDTAWRYNDYKQIYSSILGYNCQAFSWIGLWVDDTPNPIDGYVTIYLKYVTAWRGKLIPICSIDYRYLK